MIAVAPSLRPPIVTGERNGGTMANDNTRSSCRGFVVAYFLSRLCFRVFAVAIRYGAHIAPIALLSRHALVLLCIADDRRVRIRDLAAAVEITERATQRIVADLIDNGYVTRVREGRRNRYSVRGHVPTEPPAKRDVDLKSLLSHMPVVRADQLPAHGGLG